MGNLFSSILSTAGAMRAFQNGLSTVQNNVANASTPGYARQVLDFRAQPFDLAQGLPGGVLASELISYRDQYSERTVRSRQSSVGAADARTVFLSQLEPAFDIFGDSGIPGALSGLYQSFSNWSVAPNSTASRQIVLDRAARVAASFRQAAAHLSTALGETEREIVSTVTQINSLLDRIHAFNVERRASFSSGDDPRLDADYHQALEELSELVDFTVLQGEDGLTTVLIGGYAPAVTGDQVYPIQAEVTAAAAILRNAQGEDITDRLSGGKLQGLLEIRNNTFPGYRTNLDTLAAGFADRVNAVLGAGLDANGNPPVQNLFSYDAATGAAATLRIEGLAPGELAGAVAGAPGGNGNALQLAKLAGSREIDGLTFSEYYGSFAARVGQDLAAARQDSDTGASLLLQARSIRAERSQVSLDEEAARLIEYQRAYEASAKLVSVLSDLTETLIGIIR